MRGEASWDLGGAWAERRWAPSSAVCALALACFSLAPHSPLLGADDVTVALPRSDVVTSAKPYVINLTGAPAARGKGEATIVLRRAAPELKDAAAITSSVTFQFLEVAPAPPDAAQARRGAVALVVDPSALAEGEYSGVLTLTLGGAKRSTQFRFFRMPEGRPREFPFGIYATPFGKTPEEHEATLRALKAHGINLLCQHMGNMGNLGPIYDKAARLGMTFMPSTNSCGWGVKMDDALKGRLASGRATRLPCLNNPIVREGAAKMFAEWLREYRAHPAFSGLVYYGDDFALEMKHRKDGSADVACYCETCKKDFKAKTGRDIPRACEGRTGVVAPDDLLLQWMRYRCSDLYAGFMHRMRRAKDQVDPAVRIGMIHGWSERPFVNLAAATYAPLSHAPCDAVSSYCYPELVSPRMDFIAQYEIARMGNRHKDVWMLGELGVFSFVAPPWMVRQNYWNMLGAGYKLIAFFSWWDYVQAIKKGRTKEAQAASAALAECGRHKDWILPTAALWKRPEARNAVLYSFSTDAYEVLPVWRGGEHQEAVTALYREALRQHVPLRVVSEDEVRAGILKELDSLCLHGVRVLPRDVHQLIERYAAAGGAVYVRQGAKVGIGHSRLAAFDTMLALVRANCHPPVEIGDRNVTIREFLSGDARYYVFVNNSCDLYWGMSCSWGNADATYRDAQRVPDKPVETSVAFRDKGRWLFDLSTGERVGTTDAPLRLKLEPSWGRVFAALKARTAPLKVTGPARATQGETARFRLEILGERDEVVNGAFTVKATARSPSGRRSRYSAFVGLKGGVGEFALPLGQNDEIGEWALSFEGGYPRRMAHRTLRTTKGADLRDVLRARPVVPAR